ncbi:hypothetical protein CAMGR0001_0948 [Campylobacter gracilis RM3268]|uniref:Uncharacterized protein n=1 Tax=Campylobacter gracilis RM3268 TaxID=553220 RepID=C8PGF5_9BACT|nr:hypothetical protein CAMGR0001_0948 [Campylobacter gracilis RM3268]
MEANQTINFEGLNFKSEIPFLRNLQINFISATPLPFAYKIIG